MLHVTVITRTSDDSKMIFSGVQRGTYPIRLQLSSGRGSVSNWCGLLGGCGVDCYGRYHGTEARSRRGSDRAAVWDNRSDRIVACRTSYLESILQGSSSAGFALADKHMAAQHN